MMNYRLVRAACAALFLPCVALAASTADATTSSTSTQASAQARESRPQDPLEPALHSPESRTLYTLGQLISRTLDGFALTSEELRFVRQGLEDGVLGNPPKVDLAAEADGLHTLQAARRAATLQREKQAAEAFLKQVTTAPNVARLDNGVILQPLAAGHGAVPTPADQVKKKTEGLSVFLVDMRQAVGNGMTIRPIKAMINHNTTEVFFDNLRIPADSLIGQEGKGLRYIMDGLNAERILVSHESLGDAKWFIKTAVNYANERRVFDRPIGQNQGVQFPIADAYIEVEAANLMRFKACALFDAGKPCGAEANMAKWLAADAAFQAADQAMQTHGGFGYAREYHVERYWREARLMRIAPISQEMILNFVTEHVLGLPRSY